MTDHTSAATFDAHRADVERQVEVILGDRAGQLGKRAVAVTVYSHDTGQRLADVVRTAHGPVVVTYRLAQDRVTGEVAAVAPLTDDERQELALAEPYAPLAALRLRLALAEGVGKLTMRRDADAPDDGRLDAPRPDASLLARLSAERDRHRETLRLRRLAGASESAIRSAQRRLDASQADLDRAAADADSAREAARGRRNRQR